MLSLVDPAECGSEATEVDIEQMVAASAQATATEAASIINAVGAREVIMVCLNPFEGMSVYHIEGGATTGPIVKAMTHWHLSRAVDHVLKQGG